MRYRILDLETCPHPDATQWVDPVKPDSRLKDPLKIDADIAEKTRKQADEFGLDPDTCRIVALGYHDVGYGDPTVVICKDEYAETHALQLFWASYDKHYTKLVTFNGIRFDLPVLLMRSLYLGVSHPEVVIAPPWKTQHVDLWNKLSFDGARKDVHSLAFYARRFGIGTLDKVKGSDIAKLAAEGQWDAIREHCLSDIGLTHALANRLGLLKLTEVAA